MSATTIYYHNQLPFIITYAVIFGRLCECGLKATLVKLPFMNLVAVRLQSQNTNLTKPLSNDKERLKAEMMLRNYFLLPEVRWPWNAANMLCGQFVWCLLVWVSSALVRLVRYLKSVLVLADILISSAVLFNYTSTQKRLKISIGKSPISQSVNRSIAPAILRLSRFMHYHIYQFQD